MSAAVVCLGAALTACGSGGGEGYAAVGPVGGTPGALPTAALTDAVTLVPLDSPAKGGGRTPGRDGGAPSASDAPSAGGGAPSASDAPSAGGAAPGRHTERSGSGGSPGPASPGTEGVPGAGRSTAPKPSVPPSGPPPSAPKPPPSTPAPGPAALNWSEPTREPTDKRWCEDVTVDFHNSGGQAVRSGTVSFGTHIVDALGTDWATVGSAGDLPAPIAAGARKEHTWTVCVDAWRVPLGMHVETRDVHVEWK
ncbi:hypothetical protein [Streptomyces sp. NPDC001348]